jgi:integrase
LEAAVLAKISKRNIDALRPGRYLSDPEVRGFVARRLPSGAVTYGFRYRDRARKQRWLPLGLHGQITPDQARDLAKKRAGEVADDRDPQAERSAQRAAAAKTVDSVLDQFLAVYVNAERSLRTAKQIENAFNLYVRPRVGSQSIYSLRRSDIVEMLDEVAVTHGLVTADRALAYLRKAFNWHAVRDDDFRSPIVRGMAKTKPKERARDRVLSDDEIRDLWMALDELTGVQVRYPEFVRTLLLTAARRGEVMRMRWEEIDGDMWVIPAERSKNGIENAVPLTAPVKALLGHTQKSGFVFSSDGGVHPLGGHSKPKAVMDAKLAEVRKRNKRPPMKPWVQHDLRRTARSLMSRAGVVSDHAERVIGHAIPGVRGVYDRYAYLDEKRDGLERLAALIDRILHPAGAVVKFPKRKRH